jgi:hypothetical protein
MTVFTCSGTTVMMDIDPLHPRSYTTTRKAPSGYTDDANLYAYNGKLITLRTETLKFPAISSANLAAVLTVVNAAGFGRWLISWNERGTVRNIRLLAMTYQQITPSLHEVNMTVETEAAE